jgi:hypothetical protein
MYPAQDQLKTEAKLSAQAPLELVLKVLHRHEDNPKMGLK